MVGYCEEYIFGKKASEFISEKIFNNEYMCYKLNYYIKQIEGKQLWECIAFVDYKHNVRLKFNGILDNTTAFLTVMHKYFNLQMKIIDKIGANNFKIFEKYNSKLNEGNLKNEELDKINKWFKDNKIENYKSLNYENVKKLL